MAGQRSFLWLAKRSFPFWFGGAWLLCGVPFLIAGLYSGIDTWQTSEQFKREAVVTGGVVLTKRIVRDRDSSNRRYWIGYRFSAADGTVVKNEAQVSGELWDRLIEREPVRVIYLLGRPQANRIEGVGPDWVGPLIFTALGIVFAGIGALVFSMGLRGILRELRLQNDGVLAEATVVEVAPANVSFKGVPQWRIRYRYRDHRGRTLTGASSVMPPEEAQAWKVGDKAKARFDVDAPKKSIWIGNG